MSAVSLLYTMPLLLARFTPFSHEFFHLYNKQLSGVTGDGQKEAQYINKSLSALGNVLTALSKPHRDGAVIPYRDSKLTLLLQDALGGNSRTMMITCISALSSLSQHTCVALQYAQRAKTITNSATKNLASPPLPFLLPSTPPSSLIPPHPPLRTPPCTSTPSQPTYLSLFHQGVVLLSQPDSQQG